MIPYQERKLKKQFDLNKTEKHTLTFIFPPLYSCSAWGSRAGRRENSEPSMSSQSSAWPSSVMSPGLNSARTRISESDSQLHSPDSSCELTQPIETVLKTKSNSKSRSIVAYEWPELSSFIWICWWLFCQCSILLMCTAAHLGPPNKFAIDFYSAPGALPAPCSK